MIHTSRRGPAPKAFHSRSTVMLQARIPTDLMEQIEMRAAAKPKHGSTPGTGRSGVVLDALTLLFGGDAEAWRRKYVEERKARLRIELKLQRALAALQ